MNIWDPRSLTLRRRGESTPRTATRDPPEYPDDSVLSWHSSDQLLDPQHVLARSPDEFEDCSDMEPLYPLQYDPSILHPPQVTSWGIALRTNALQTVAGSRREIHHHWRPGRSFPVGSPNDSRPVAWRGNFEDLPSVLLLVQSRPARYTYRWERVTERMCRR